VLKQLQLQAARASAQAPIYLSVYLFVYLSIHPIYKSICLSVCLSIATPGSPQNPHRRANSRSCRATGRAPLSALLSPRSCACVGS
jgi:hypothetical protein